MKKEQNPIRKARVICDVCKKRIAFKIKCSEAICETCQKNKLSMNINKVMKEINKTNFGIK